MEVMTAAHLLREYLKDNIPFLDVTGGAGSDRLLVQVGPDYKTNIVINVHHHDNISMGLWTVSNRKSVKDWTEECRVFAARDSYNIHDPESFPKILEKIQFLRDDFERLGLSV